MKKTTTFVLVIGAMILSFAGNSHATVLGTIESNRAGSDLGEFTGMTFSICYPLPGDRESISLSWSVTTDDVGQAFFASADTHENFDSFTYFLTNGIDDGLFLSDNHSIFIFNSRSGLPEPMEYESTLIPGIEDGVDFERYTIDSITLTANELFLDYDADAIKGGLTNYSYDITYTINGIVPEPGTVFLLGLGGLALVRKRRLLR